MDIWLKRTDSAKMAELSGFRRREEDQDANGTRSAVSHNGRDPVSSPAPASNMATTLESFSASAPVSIYVDAEAYANYDSNTLSLPEHVREKLAELELEFAEGKKVAERRQLYLIWLGYSLRLIETRRMKTVYFLDVCYF